MPRQKRLNNSFDKDPQELRGKLLDWYDHHARILPWRARRGQTPNPYHVWLSEIMLQQTTVGAVKSYFEHFITKWPTVHDLAAAPSDDIMQAWAGLGYYARARNLHKCAQIVAHELEGVFPQDQKSLKTLPGIGEYTSAAICAIAFNQPATVVDGNIERVMARVFNVQEALPKSKPKLKDLAHIFFNGYEERPGDLAQAFMDLGAGVCIAKTPRCMLCPVSEYCQAYKKGTAGDLPKKVRKKSKPQKHGYIYWIANNHGEVLLHRRPNKGLLGGTLALPTSAWVDRKQEIGELNELKDISFLDVHIAHSFTHFDLKLYLRQAKNHGLDGEHGYSWVKREDISPNNFPTVFKKAVTIFLKAL